MPIDFPNSPTSGQTYTVGAITWQWDGSTWKALGSSNPGRDYVSATAPSSPAEGARWLNSNDLKTYTYYDSQWIESSPNLKGETGLQGQPAGNNVIINGAFDINQRQFVSTTTSGTYGFDRWFNANNEGTVTTSAQTFTPGAAPVAGYEAVNYIRQVTTGQSASNSAAYISQRVEDVRTLAGQTATISFWARAGSGTPKVAVSMAQNFGAGGSAGVDITVGQVTISTTWARYSLTLQIPSIAGATIGTGSMLRVFLWGSAGSNFLTTSNIGIQSNTFDYWGVQLEAGSVATPFRRNGSSLQAELAACQRYYYRLTPGTAGAGLGIGQATSTTGWRGGINFPVEMRVAPTALEQSGTANQYSIGMAGGGGGTLNAVPVFSGTTTRWATVNATVASGLTQFQFAYLQTDVTNGAAAYLGWSAEL